MTFPLTQRMPGSRTAWLTPLRAATFAAAALLLCGAAMHAVALRLGTLDAGRALPPGTLAAIPRTIGRWEGRDLALDGAILRTAQIDECVYRAYARDETEPSITLFVSAGARPRDLLPHRPDVCYPAAGWLLESVTPVQISKLAGGDIAARWLTFRRPGLSARSLLVFNTFLVDGASHADVSALRSAFLSRRATGHVIIQVQALRQISGDPERDRNEVLDFFSEVMPLVFEIDNRARASQ